MGPPSTGGAEPPSGRIPVQPRAAARGTGPRRSVRPRPPTTAARPWRCSRPWSRPPRRTRRSGAPAGTGRNRRDRDASRRLPDGPADLSLEERRGTRSSCEHAPCVRCARDAHAGPNGCCSRAASSGHSVPYIGHAIQNLLMVVPGASGAPATARWRLRAPGPAHDDQKTIESTVLNPPTPSKITPTVCRSTPLVLVVWTANARIAPAAMSRSPSPKPMVGKPPSVSRAVPDVGDDRGGGKRLHTRRTLRRPTSCRPVEREARSGAVNAGLLVCAEPRVTPECARAARNVCPAAYGPVRHRAEARAGHRRADHPSSAPVRTAADRRRRNAKPTVRLGNIGQAEPERRSRPTSPFRAMWLPSRRALRRRQVNPPPRITASSAAQKEFRTRDTRPGGPTD